MPSKLSTWSTKFKAVGASSQEEVPLLKDLGPTLQRVEHKRKEVEITTQAAWSTPPEGFWYYKPRDPKAVPMLCPQPIELEPPFVRVSFRLRGNPQKFGLWRGLEQFASLIKSRDIYPKKGSEWKLYEKKIKRMVEDFKIITTVDSQRERYKLGAVREIIESTRGEHRAPEWNDLLGVVEKWEGLEESGRLLERWESELKGAQGRFRREISQF
ncbi:MAG: hypothetical protein Q9220_001844 [cf. Caloplaca sp. 1 TL-2023]